MRLLVVLVPVLLVGCGGGPAAAGKGVLFGTVARGPGGACPSQVPCSTPASGITLSFSRGDAPAFSTTTNATGHYRVRLPAGRYSVEGPQPLKPRHVDVPAGGSLRVDFAVDSKIS